MHGRQFVDFSTWICRRSSLPSSQHLMMVKKNAATAFKMCLPTYYSPIDQYILYSYQIKTRRNLNNNSPIMGIHKKEFFTFFLLPLTVRIEQKKLCSVTSFEFKKKNQNSF